MEYGKYSKNFYTPLFYIEKNAEYMGALEAKRVPADPAAKDTIRKADISIKILRAEARYVKLSKYVKCKGDAGLMCLSSDKRR